MSAFSAKIGHGSNSVRTGRKWVSVRQAFYPELTEFDSIRGKSDQQPEQFHPVGEMMRWLIRRLRMLKK
jgi:hypothetical protein